VKISRVDTNRCLVGEGPLWDVAEQALYFVDIVGQKVHRYDYTSGKTRSWAAPNKIGSMALREQGGAILALPDGVYTLDFDSGEIAPLATVSGLNPRIQFNDGKVDRRGRFIVGSTDSDIKDCTPIGSVYRLDADHSLTEIDTDIHISNGPCWSPDNKTFYFSDSLPYTVYAYDYDIAAGKAANRRVFADTRDLGGIPDGATVDSDGLLWMAICEGAKVVAFAPNGKVERIIDMPAKLTASVMFGGPNLDLLYVTTIDQALLGREGDLSGGHTYVIEGLGAKGIAESRYAG
jgi:sugar lactone lactonase YvrE